VIDPRTFTAILAFIVLGLATACVLLYRWVEKGDGGAHGLSARLLTYSLWVLALLGVYSGTSFIWANGLDDAWLEVLRLIRLALTTAVGIMLCGVLAYWLRIVRRAP
jgi:hypothetical protein